MPLQHLFDAELTYRTGIAPLADHGEGQLIGSGDGSVHGQRVRAALRWTLFEGPGALVCTMNPSPGDPHGRRRQHRHPGPGLRTPREPGPASNGMSPRRCCSA